MGRDADQADRPRPRRSAPRQSGGMSGMFQRRVSRPGGEIAAGRGGPRNDEEVGWRGPLVPWRHCEARRGNLVA